MGEIGKVVGMLMLMIWSAAVGVDAGGELEVVGGLMGSWSSGCKGGGTTVGECIGLEEEELEMDWEVIERRILATTNHISYNAIKKGSQWCAQRGASYYNCRPGAQANPYRRGCSKITRCQR